LTSIPQKTISLAAIDIGALDELGDDPRTSFDFGVGSFQYHTFLGPHLQTKPPFFSSSGGDDGGHTGGGGHAAAEGGSFI
jgi:hypothetical protein